jgi:hypothetical protein
MKANYPRARARPRTETRTGGIRIGTGPAEMSRFSHLE